MPIDLTAPTALVLNDDRTITVPWKDEDGTNRAVELGEPTTGEIEVMWGLMERADAEMKRLVAEVMESEDGSLPNISVDVIETAIQASQRSPYAVALVDLIQALSAQTVPVGRLYGWAGKSDTLALMFRHWQAPLAGPASRVQRILDAGARAAANQPTPAPTNGTSPVV